MTNVGGAMMSDSRAPGLPAGLCTQDFGTDDVSILQHHLTCYVLLEAAKLFSSKLRSQRSMRLLLFF